MSIVQRQRGQKRISPVARCWAIPHGGGIPQIQPEGACCVYDIFLFTEPRDKHSPNPALLERWNRCITPVRLLYHDDQRKAWICPEVGIVTVPDPFYDRAELATPDPEIPAQDDEATEYNLLCWRCEVQRHVRAYIAAPLFQTPTLVIFMP